jgi:hypothetical protein
MSRITMLLTFIAVLIGSLLLTATTAPATTSELAGPDGNCCLAL